MDEFYVPLPKFNTHSLTVQRRCDGRLLDQQSDALRALQRWFWPDSPTKDDIALVSMPTGSGKTGVMCCLPYVLGSIGLQEGHNPPVGEPEYKFDKPVLVIAPDLAIVNQLERQMLDTEVDRGENFLVRRGIIPEAARGVLPQGIRIEETSKVNDRHHLQGKDYVIANAQKFLRGTWEQVLPDDMFKLVVVDEAHHHPAKTWRRIVQKFQGHAMTVFFTATPFRGDGIPVLENTPLAFRLQLEDAIAAGIIRRTNFEELTGIHPLPNGIAVKDTNDPAQVEEIQRYTMILQRARLIQIRKDRETPLPDNLPHTIIVIAKNTFYAEVVTHIWNTLWPEAPAEWYHSDMKKRNQQTVMRKLRNNELKLVVIVQMLLEGFDHQPISIAAITTRIRSPVKFTQFVGRSQRICRGAEAVEINGVADIVTHSDYQQRENYDMFIREEFIPNEFE